MHDGTKDDDDDGGYPILMAVKDRVFDVGAEGRSSVLRPGMANIASWAGGDASRFLARNILIEETRDEGNVKLSAAEEANLEMWYWIIRNKYPSVGTYNGETRQISRINSKKREQ